MTTSSSTDSTESAPAAESEQASEVVAEIVPELVAEDDLVEGADAVSEAFAVEIEEDAEAGSGSAVAAGAAAITAAALALTSLGGNWLGNVLTQRQQLLGQIATPNSAANEIIKQRYTEPWHRMAFVSMWFAVSAMVIAAATLVFGDFLAKRPMPVWVRALTWAALALGLIGVGMAVAIYSDWFTGTITVPAGS
jgi:hypothetical protein